MKEKKFDNKDNLLDEILHCLNQVVRTKVNSKWFKNTYEICEEIGKYKRERNEEKVSIQ